MANFKTVTVKGFTKQEALEQAPFQIIKDATQAWKKAGQPVEAELKAFCESYLSKNTRMAQGIGCSITLDAGSINTRKRPYVYTNCKNEKGKRKFRRSIQGVNAATGEILFTCFDTKADARKMGDELYKNGYTGNITANIVENVVEGEAKAFEMSYVPSKNTKLGSYLAFGVEA